MMPYAQWLISKGLTDSAASRAQYQQESAPAAKQNLVDLAKSSLAALMPAVGQRQAANLPPSAQTPDAMRALGVKNPDPTQAIDPQIAAERAQQASELAQQNDATKTDKKFFATQLALAQKPVDLVTHPDVAIRDHAMPDTPGSDVAQGEFGKKQMVLTPATPAPAPAVLPSSDQTESPDHTPNTDPALPGRDPTDEHIKQALAETPPAVVGKIADTAKSLGIPIMQVLQAALAGYTAQKTGRPFNFQTDTIAGSNLARKQALEDQAKQIQAQTDAQQRQFDFSQSMAAEQQRFAQEAQAAQTDQERQKAADDHQNRLAEMRLEYSLAGKNQLAAIAAQNMKQNATAGSGPFDTLVR